MKSSISLVEPPSATELQAAFDELRGLLNQSDFSQAEGLARSILVTIPSSAVAHRFLAHALLGSGLLDQALESVSEALRISQSFPEAWHTRARILMAKREFEAAIESGLLAINGEPNYAEAHHTLAQCYLVLCQMDMCVQKAREALALAPEFTEAHYTLGTAHQKLDCTVEAEAAFRAALALKPDYVEALNSLGTVLQEQNRLLEAQSMFQRAVELKPDYTNAHNNLGFLMRQLGRHHDAAASFRIAHDLFEPHLVLRLPEHSLAKIVDLSRRYFRVSRDITRWSRGSAVRNGGWTEYQLLHQATNGKSSDFFSSVLKRLKPTRKSESGFRKSAIFPWVREPDVLQIVQSLNQNGYYVFDKLISASLVDELLKFALENKAQLTLPVNFGQTHAVYDPGKPVASGYVFNESDMLADPAFQRFAGDPLLLAISEMYLGVEPKLAYLTMWWSTVSSRKPTSDMAQLFHTDLAHIKWLKIFVYLTDVTMETGPHSFVKGSHVPDAEGRDLRSRGLVRLCDEDIVDAYGRERIIDIVGPKGTVFIADSRGFHKGNNPSSGHRLVLQLYHVSSLYPDSLRRDENPLIPVESALLETLKYQPDVYARYGISLETEK